MGNPADRRIGLDSDAVAAASKRVGSHGDDVRASHSATKAALDDGLYGCVGNSGEELSRLSQRWAAVGARHGERIDALSRRVGEAGVNLTNTDYRSADQVARVGDEARDL
jgi:uncharacterized protein YukE